MNVRQIVIHIFFLSVKFIDIIFIEYPFMKVLNRFLKLAQFFFLLFKEMFKFLLKQRHYSLIFFTDMRLMMF